MKAYGIAMSTLGLFLSLSSITVEAGAPDLPRVLSNDDAVSRIREIVPYIKNLRSEEVPSALKKAIAGHGAGREDTIDLLSDRWVELDAPAALAFARQITDRDARGFIASAFYNAWAERDPDGAVTAANQASPGERAGAIWKIVRKIGPREPQRARELIKSIHSAKRTDSDYFIFWHWAKINLAQATQTLLQEAKVAGSSYLSEMAVCGITDRLLEDDPKAATKWVAQLPPGKIHDEALERLESEWAKTDRDAVNVWLKSLPGPDQERNASWNPSQKKSEDPPPRIKIDPAFAKQADELNKILYSNLWPALAILLPLVDGLSPNEFPQVLELLRNAPDSNRDTVLDLLVARWSKVDPAGMIRAIPVARTIHDSEFSEQFLKDVYAAWSQRDPEAALAAATRYGHGDALPVILAALARQDPAKAYLTFRKLNDPNSHLLVTPIFTEWAVRDLPAATKAFSKESHLDGAIEGIVIGLMRQSPAAAIAWARHLSVKDQRDRALHDVADRWSAVDPEAAAAWLEKGPAFDGKNSAFDDVAVNWVNRDAVEALHHAMTLDKGKEQDVLLYWGIASLTYDDAEAAVRFARGLSEAEMRKDALATALAFWSEYEPKAAADYLTSVATEATPDNVAGIAASLSYRDPVSAVHWLDKLSSPVDKAPATGKIAENWYRRDTSATESWVKQLPAGPLYDAGAQGICTALDRNWQPALKWARSIRDPKRCHDAVYHAFEVATYKIFIDSQGIKDEIRSAPELTNADKNSLIARIPELKEIRGPQLFKKT